ncbi:MAG TPA: DUF6055 domain-containing protein [Thermoanaerobaculia bacterium]|nr:DUF6055 domain-containing protein [Thermoanaerobaculia bacterium]
MFRPRIVLSLLVILIVPVAVAQNPIRRHAVIPPVATTSVQLIDQALAAGQIDGQTALEYHVFADFNDPRLPAQFRGTVPPQNDSMSVALAEAQWDSLSPQIQQALTPYTLPPFVKGSWESPQSATRIGPLDISRPCVGVDDNWLWTESSQGNIRVWWKKSHPEDAASAQGMLNDGEAALSQYEGLLGRNHMPDGGSADPCHGGSDAIDVALDDVNTTETMPYFPDRKACPTFIVIQRGPGRGDSLQATLAHELFHVMQFTYDVDAFNVSGYYLWLMEATAQWAQDFHRRPANSGEEQRAAHLWFDAPDVSLTSTKNYHDYGAYLFFLYLSRTYGDSIIKDIWDETQANSATDAVDHAIPGGFKERWPEFALDAWNQGDIQQFQQWDQITAGANEDTENPLGGRPDVYNELTTDLPGLSARYYHYTFDGSVRAVAFLNGLTYQLHTGDLTIDGIDMGPQFQFSDASDDQKRGASVQAIIKKDGQWQQPATWTDTKYKTFCREKADEHIDELVLIFANSDTDDERQLKPASIAPMVIATNIGCEWDGKLQFALAPMLAPAAGNLTVEDDITKDPADAPPPVPDFLGYEYVTNGHASWSTSGSVGECSISGHNDNAPVRSDVGGTTFNFAPPGSLTYRHVYFPVLLPAPIPITIACPQATTTVSAPGGFVFPSDPSFLPNLFLPVGADGQVHGTMSDVSGTWQYQFTPKQQ